VTTPVEGGLRLDSYVEENLYFNQVIFARADEPPSEASAAAAMQIQLGDAYRKENWTPPREVAGHFAGRRLYQAKVAAETVIHAETSPD